MAGQLSTKRCPSPLHVGPRELPLEEFHRSNATKDGRKSWCKGCMKLKAQEPRQKELARVRSARWIDKNREECNRKSLEKYYRLSEGKVRRRKFLSPEEQRRNRRESYEQFMARNPEVNKEYQHRYYMKNRDRYKTWGYLRRQREESAPGNLTPEKLQARWLYYGGKCWMCGCDATTYDHVKPLSKGGSNWASNIRPACKSCNSRKNAQWPYPVAI